MIFDEEPLALPGQWSLRKLKTDDWALQYKGVNWVKITEFLPVERSTLDEEMRRFAADMMRQRK